jgi:hypothetical protein
MEDSWMKSGKQLVLNETFGLNCEIDGTRIKEENFWLDREEADTVFIPTFGRVVVP